MNCTFEEYLIELGERSATDYIYDNGTLFQCIGWFRECWANDVAPYYALLDLNQVIKTKQNKMEKRKEINIKELSIGNFVGIKYDAHETVYKVACLMFNHVQVESETGDTKSVNIEAIEPIALTIDWILKLEDGKDEEKLDTYMGDMYTYVHRYQNLLTLID